MALVVHLSSVHHATDHRIFYKEARHAARAGYEVVVVARHPEEEVKDEVRIVPLPEARSRFSRMLLSPWRILRLALSLPGDIYHFHDPELIPVGLALKLKGKKVVYDIHEITSSQILLKEWIPAWLRKPLARVFGVFERFAVSKFDGVSVPQPYMEDLYKTHARRVALTRNFVEIGEIPPLLPLSDRPYLLYAGALGRARGLLNMVRAMPYIREGHRLRLVGNCPPSLLSEARREKGWERVDYTPWVPFHEIVDVYGQSSIGLILYENVGQYHMANAVKLFEFLAWGMPVVMPDFGEWPDFNARVRCGITVDTSDPHAVASAVNELIDDPELARALGNNGRENVVKNFSWEVEFRNLSNLYNYILNN